jgi:hypothetical protein
MGALAVSFVKTLWFQGFGAVGEPYHRFSHPLLQKMGFQL